MKDFILKIWKDPVWSKVIASGIIGLLTLIYIANRSIIKNISFQESLKQIMDSGISLKLILLLIVILILIRFFYIMYLVKPFSDIQLKNKSDPTLLSKLKKETTIPKSSISIYRTNKLIREPYFSKLRRMEFYKYFTLLSGISLLFLGSIQFYSAPRPSYKPLYSLHDILHGKAFYWEEQTLKLYKRININNYKLILTRIDFKQDTTNIYYKCSIIDNDTSFNDFGLLYSLQTGTRDTTYLRYPIYNEIYSSSPGQIEGVLIFPSYIGITDNLALWIKTWDGHSKQNYELLMWLSNIPDGNGSPIWAIVFLIGIIISGYAAILNPSETIRKELTKIGRELRNEMDYDLERFLSHRKYIDLSPADKRRYNRIIRYYNDIENQILK